MIFASLFASGLFVGMLMLLEGGRRLGKLRQAKADEGGRAGLGAVEGAVFGLLGLLIAFTFSSAAGRFDARRQLIVNEANAIGTAWLRLDLLPEAAQPELRDLFRRYLDARLAIYENIQDQAATAAEFDRANQLQTEIWRRAVTASQNQPSPLTAQLIPALNEMFDIATSRTMAARTHMPAIIFIMLGILALVCSMLAGYAMAGAKRHSWIHIIGFALIMATTVYVILDLEFPRLGIIRVDSHDRVLIELRQSMK